MLIFKLKKKHIIYTYGDFQWTPAFAGGIKLFFAAIKLGMMSVLKCGKYQNIF